jgi:hypothetical protein
MTTPDPAAASSPPPAPPAHAIPRTSLGAAQWMLARLWFIGAGVILVVLILRSINQTDPNCTTCDTTVRFTWFSSAFGPTLLLIAGAISGTDDSAASRTVSTQAYRLTLLVSIFYLIAALIPTLARFQDPTTAIKTAAWIPAIQGVVALLLGRLFAPSSK